METLRHHVMVRLVSFGLVLFITYKSLSQLESPITVTVKPRNTGCQLSRDQQISSVIGEFLPIKEVKRNDWKGPKFSIHYWRISVTLGSGIEGFNCMYNSPFA